MVPLPRFAWESKSAATAGVYDPPLAGEGDRPKDGGGGRTAQRSIRTTAFGAPLLQPKHRHFRGGDLRRPQDFGEAGGGSDLLLAIDLVSDDAAANGAANLLAP